jgi:aspartyl-tRNA(Asn)/glutamyl-tRNA(Gln) amidotransferase subunit A
VGGAFWEIDDVRAAHDAEMVLRRREGTGPRVLDGVPVAVKDAFDVSGLAQHLGLTRGIVSDRDAVAVARLRNAGAIVIGTTAMDQLGWTMTGQAPGYPRCDNPLLPGRTPGGSSGGAAAAVAAGIVPLALAADSAGSVRVPAAWCGVVGFKPTFGAIDLDGCAPLAPCFDTAGIISRYVDDCRLAFPALAGARPVGKMATPRVGVCTALIAATDCDADILNAWSSTIERLSTARLVLREVSAPSLPRGTGAVFAANLASRWGDVVDVEPKDLVHPAVRAGVDYGRSVAARALLEACDAVKAARSRAASLLDDVDLLVLPTAPVPPPPFDEPAPVSVASAFTRPWSVFGWPAISVPSPGANVPGYGIQLVARPGDDIRLLSWASELEALMRDGSKITRS